MKRTIEFMRMALSVAAEEATNGSRADAAELLREVADSIEKGEVYDGRRIDVMIVDDPMISCEREERHTIWNTPKDDRVFYPIRPDFEKVVKAGAAVHETLNEIRELIDSLPKLPVHPVCYAAPATPGPSNKPKAAYFGTAKKRKKW